MSGLSDFGPVERHERIQGMDALRGFALLGVLTINMFTFIGPFDRMFDHWASWRWLQFFVLMMVQGKFYCLFSWLFGMGFSVQLQRLEARGLQGNRLYRRRLAVLLCLGLAQGLLIWMGDILFSYAVLGFVLLTFRRRSDRVLWVSACVLIGFSTLFILREALLGGIHVQLSEGQAEAIRAYAQGPYAALFKVRLKQLLENYTLTLVGVGPQILGMFLLGAYVGRRGWLADPVAHRTSLKRMAFWGLGLGLPMNAVYAAMMQKGGMPAPGHLLPLYAQLIFIPFGPLLTLGMAAAFILVLPTWRALQALAPAGRMALTHYLTHSVVFTTVFSFWGTGTYGRIPTWWAPPLALATWWLQVAVSPWWLRHFRMGPVEWVWRSLTYGKAQPFRSQEA